MNYIHKLKIKHLVKYVHQEKKNELNLTGLTFTNNSIINMGKSTFEQKYNTQINLPDQARNILSDYISKLEDHYTKKSQFIPQQPTSQSMKEKFNTIKQEISARVKLINERQSMTRKTQKQLYEILSSEHI